MAFLFGKAETLTPEQRRNAMYGEVPILHLYAAHTVLLANPFYFTMKTAGVFLCNSPATVEQLKIEDKLLDDTALVNSFIAAGTLKVTLFPLIRTFNCFNTFYY